MLHPGFEPAPYLPIAGSGIASLTQRATGSRDRNGAHSFCKYRLAAIIFSIISRPQDFVLLLY